LQSHIADQTVSYTIPVPANGEWIRETVLLVDVAGNDGPASNSDTALVDTTIPLVSGNNVGPVSDTTPLMNGATDQPDGALISIFNTQGRNCSGCRCRRFAGYC